jgi:hypothetical protein
MDSTAETNLCRYFHYKDELRINKKLAGVVISTTTTWWMGFGPQKEPDGSGREGSRSESSGGVLFT